jgi:hypothetical protein
MNAVKKPYRTRWADVGGAIGIGLFVVVILGILFYGYSL